MADKIFVITKDKLISLLGELASDSALIAPIKNELGDVNFLPVAKDGISKISFEYENTVNSPKEYFHPDSEALFTFKGTSHDDIEPAGEAEEMVLFGVRPCDVAALRYLDRVFSLEYQDGLYLERRQRAALITVGCSECYEGCFCTAMGTGPFLEGGFDIQLVPLNGKFAVYVDSDKGRALTDKYRRYLKDAGDAERKDAELVVLKAAKCRPKFKREKVYDNLKSGKADEALWRDISSRCQSCGLCLFICPTCYCFTVNDRERADGYKSRSRQWDACYFRGFTRMAGGSDPVGSNTEMVKRKYNHKLWHDVDRFGMSGCTGCGRCNNSCVGNVNWLNNIVKIEKGG